MKVSCSLQTFTSTEDDNNSTNLTQSVWNEVKLRKVDPKLMDEQLKVQFALELNPNFVQMTGISLENLLIRWREQNPDKRLFDLELHEDSLIKGQLENQGQFMTELKWLKRAEIQLNIRFNCFSAQFMDNPNTTFLLYLKIFNIRTFELIDTVCCQIKIQENKPKSVKLIHFEQIQLQEYSNVNENGNVIDEVNDEIDENVVENVVQNDVVEEIVENVVENVVGDGVQNVVENVVQNVFVEEIVENAVENVVGDEVQNVVENVLVEEIKSVAETENVVNANDIPNSNLNKINSKLNVSESKISYYKWLSIVIVTNLLRAFSIFCLFCIIFEAYKYGFSKERNFFNIVFLIPLASSFYFNFRSWIRSIHCVFVLFALVDDVFIMQIDLQNIPNHHKVFIYLNTFLFVTTFIPKALIANIIYLISLAGFVVVRSLNL